MPFNKLTKLNKELLLENLAGGLSAALVATGILASLWFLEHQDRRAQATLPSAPLQQQSLKASSVTVEEVEKYYEKRRAELAEQARRAAEKKRKAEQARRAAEEKRKAEQARRAAARAKAEAERLSRLREQEAQQAEFIRIGKRIGQRVRARWKVPPKLPQGLRVKLSIKLSSRGKVIGKIRVIKSSGYPAFDRSAIEAIKRASPLPLPRKKAWAKAFTAERLVLNFP